MNIHTHWSTASSPASKWSTSYYNFVPGKPQIPLQLSQVLSSILCLSDSCHKGLGIKFLLFLSNLCLDMAILLYIKTGGIQSTTKQLKSNLGTVFAFRLSWKMKKLENKLFAWISKDKLSKKKKKSALLQLNRHWGEQESLPWIPLYARAETEGVHLHKWLHAPITSSDAHQ